MVSPSSILHTAHCSARCVPSRACGNAGDLAQLLPCKISRQIRSSCASCKSTRCPAPASPETEKHLCFAPALPVTCTVSWTSQQGEGNPATDTIASADLVPFLCILQSFHAAGCAHQTAPAAFELRSVFQSPHPLLIDHTMITSGFAVCFPLQERGFRDYGLFFQFAPC